MNMYFFCLFIFSFSKWNMMVVFNEKKNINKRKKNGGLHSTTPGLIMATCGKYARA